MDFNSKKIAESSLPLHQAIWKRDENAVINYLKKEEDLNVEDDNGLKPIYIAIMTGNEKILKHLLKDKKVVIDMKTWYYIVASQNKAIVSRVVDYKGKFDKNCGDKNGLTPLHHAIINRKTSLISPLRRILECDIDSQTKNGYTALHFSAVANDLISINDLLQRRADTSIKSVDGYTALHLAIEHGHIDSVNLLLAMRCNVNDIVDSTGSSALHIAVKNNDESMIILLLQNNANFVGQDDSGKNLVHVAAEYGHEKWVKFFMDKGINVNEITNDNSTPLLIALIENKPNIATLLLNKGVDVNIRNSDGLSPLRAAIQHNNIKLAKRLVTLGADLHNLTVKGSSVLHYAAKYCNKNVLVYLVKSGAKLGARDYLGQNELHIAAERHENSDMLQYLLQSGMNINGVTLNKSTALHYAVGSKDLSRNNIDVLIKHGIAVDSVNESGDTALNILCRSSCVDKRYNIIEQLLMAKADPNHEGSDKKMPLYICIEKYNISTALLLAKYGANCNKTNSDGDSVIQLLIKFHSGCVCTRMSHISNFLDYGTDINNVNEDGETVLHTSLRFEEHETLPEIEYLLDKGVRFSTNKLDESVLHVAIKYLGTKSVIKSIVKFFLEKDLCLNNHTTNGSNIIHYVAQFSDNSKIMKMLLDKTDRYLINSKNRERKTPLHIAASLGSCSLVEVLLEHDADINKKDDDNNTAINHAIIGNHIEIVKLLLKKGASVTDKNKDGFSAYDLAEQKDRHIYQLLLFNR